MADCNTCECVYPCSRARSEWKRELFEKCPLPRSKEENQQHKKEADPVKDVT